MVFLFNLLNTFIILYKKYIQLNLINSIHFQKKRFKSILNPGTTSNTKRLIVIDGTNVAYGFLCFKYV